MMSCAFCGKQVIDNAVRCPYCGMPVAQKESLEKLVNAARNGDQDAISALYEKTYSKVYYTVKSMIRDEDAVFDIVQDAYIKAFDHLESFQGDEKFLPWVRQIAANTARDWLKKKRPMLFTELNSGDAQDTLVEELLAEERSENLPEQIMEQEETKRLLREIIGELPEDQRAAIGMFYYEEMSVKEIAEAMGASESAVKSRLMYGRSKIEKKIRELEKRGTKLYSLSPIAFLLLLFRNQKAYATARPDSRILHTILSSQPKGDITMDERAGNADTVTAVVQDAATTTEATRGAGISRGLGALKIGMITVAAVVAVGLGTFGVTQMASRSVENQEVSNIEVASVEEELEAAKETEVSDSIGEALEQYRIIISQAESYEYGEDETKWSWIELVGYRYALVQMWPNDPVPTLLLEREVMDTELSVSHSYARVFRYDPDTKSVCQPTEAIADGGTRGGLSVAGDGYGIMSTQWSGGTGEGSVTRITLDGDSLNQELYWTGQILEIPDSITFVEIEWHKSQDLSAVDSWTVFDSAEAAAVQPSDSDMLLTDGERIVLTGTVGTYDYDEIIALQGQPDPNGFDERTVEISRSMTYRVIVLDTPQILNLRVGDILDDYYSKEALLISIDYADGMDQYEGQHITFSIDPATTWWPSGTDLPFGQPNTKDICVLD